MKTLFYLSFLLMSLSPFSNAQTNLDRQWTWVQGDSLGNVEGAYGLQGIESPLNKPPARSKGAQWKDSDGNLWLFGGTKSSNNYLNDLWKFNISTKAWVWIKGSDTVNQKGSYGVKGFGFPGNTPGARNGCVSWTDNDGNFWLFGGHGYSSTEGVGLLNDLWKYSPSINMWTWVSGSLVTNTQGNYGTIGIPSNTNIPGAREDSYSSFDTNGNLWLFAGAGIMSGTSRSYLNDVWKFNIATNQWTWMKGGDVDPKGSYNVLGQNDPNNNPGCRLDGFSWTDDNNNFWISCGYGYDANRNRGLLNSTWKYSKEANQWAWMSGDSIGRQQTIYGVKGLPSVHNNPGGREGSITWRDSEGNFWLMGGFYVGITSYGYKNDVWKFEPYSLKWTWVKGDSTIDPTNFYGEQNIPGLFNTPGGRYNSFYWTGSNNEFYLFGGGGLTQGNYSQKSDLWKLSDRNFSYVIGCANIDTAITTLNTGTNYQWQMSVDSITFVNIADDTNYAGTLTSTLRFWNLPSSWYGRQYRCVVDDVVDKLYSLIFVSKWTGVVSNEWENPANWSCNRLPDNYTDVVIDSGQVTINSDVNIRSLFASQSSVITILSPFILTTNH